MFWDSDDSEKKKKEEGSSWSEVIDATTVGLIVGLIVAGAALYPLAKRGIQLWGTKETIDYLSEPFRRKR